MKSQGDVIMPRGYPGANPGAKQSNGVWGLGTPQIPQVGALGVAEDVRILRSNVLLSVML